MIPNLVSLAIAFQRAVPGLTVCCHSYNSKFFFWKLLKGLVNGRFESFKDPQRTLPGRAIETHIFKGKYKGPYKPQSPSKLQL